MPTKNTSLEIDLPNGKISASHWEIIIEIIFLHYYGFSSKQIGGLLNLSKKTIDKYREHFYTCMGVKKMNGLMHYVLENNIHKNEDLIIKFKKHIENITPPPNYVKS